MNGSNGYDEVARYLAAFKAYPVLHDEKEFLRLFRLYQSGSDEEKKDARDRMIYGNVRLVVSIARSMRDKGLSMQDMLQVGVLGLDAALKKFDPSLGYRFSTYASWWVRSIIAREILTTGEQLPFRMPSWVYEQLRVVRTASARYYADHRERPAPEDVLHVVMQIGSERTKRMKIEKVVELMERTRQTVVSFDGPAFSANAHGEEGLSLGETIHAAAVEPDAMIANVQLATRVQKALACLTPKEAVIVRKRFGLDDGNEQTLKEIGKEFNLTRERIRQIEAKALRKLKTALGASSAEQLRAIVRTS